MIRGLVCLLLLFSVCCARSLREPYEAPKELVDSADPCLAFSSNCSSCISVDGCGWCPYYGECFSGNEEAPTNATCPSDPQLGSWETQVCCSDFWTCADCSNHPSCGWCTPEQWCYQGNASGPSAPDLFCFADSFGGWEYDSCCSDYSDGDCKICTNDTKCGFCPSTNECYPGNQSGPINGLQCNVSDYTGAWLYGDCCFEHYTCGECTQHEQCGWCPTRQVCLSGNADGPSGITCAASNSSGAWAYDYCCQARTNCSSCLADGKCGWCPSLQECFAGSMEGPANGVECVADANGGWEYESCCSDALNCQNCAKLPACGWCNSEACFSGDAKGPFDGNNCTQWNVGTC